MSKARKAETCGVAGCHDAPDQLGICRRHLAELPPVVRAIALNLQARVAGVEQAIRESVLLSREGVEKLLAPVEPAIETKPGDTKRRRK